MAAKNRLLVSRLTSIGAVEDGDNPASAIMLYKTRSDVTTVLETDPGQGKPITEKHEMADLDLAAVDDDLRAEIEKALNDRDTEIVSLTKAAEKAAEVDGDDGDPVLKGLSDEAAARFAELEKSNQATADELVKERDARRTAEWIGKARTDYPTILKDADEAGPHLKVLTDTDSADWLLAKFKDFEAVLAASDLFKEIGATDGGTAIDKIEELAKEVRKDNPKLTAAQARALVRKGNPELKAAEREERKN